MSVIFALDSSGQTGGVCVLSQGEILFERTLNEGLTHSQTLLPLMQKAFAEAKISPADVSAYAVSAGPGSFTGLRIGIALAKGMALGFGTPIVPVSTLRALAVSTGLQGRIVCALNARRGQVYWAAFEQSRGNGAPLRLAKDAAGVPEDIVKSGVLDAENVFIVGDGAEICYNKMSYMGNVQMPQCDLWPMAVGLARVAYGKFAQGLALCASEVRPSYLRQSQAERERSERLKFHNI